MPLVRYEPWTLMTRLHRELDELFRDPLTTTASGTEARPAALLPNVDVQEEADRYVIRADLPGVQPADIQITADQGVLTLRAERRVENREGNAANGRYERFAGTFTRRFTLPQDANAEAIGARSEHGVLELTIPKQAKPEPRRITVEVA
ncbi:MAG: Hsp20/alpha crystallin family protein [Steroidobacteraceae bacterium]|nr:Hsp20/alpha crystallin family protein [Nevskiaceae bacterium]MCP5471132.1 Hsp20/alpha crystallin family protein [Nevskiaceae bacterium]